MMSIAFKHVAQTVVKPLAALSALSVAACGPLISFGDDGPADQIFGLEYDGGRQSSDDLTTLVYMEEPLMSDGLSGTQVSVVLPGNQRTSLMGVRWSTNSADLVRDYLVRGVSSESGIRMLGEGALDLSAGCHMGLKVWAFEFVPGDSAGDDRVDVEIEFSLVRYSDNRLIGQPTFNSSVRIAGSEGADVADDFDQAMRVISREAGAWVASTGTACTLE